MSEDLHRRAERLMLESTLGPIPDSERWWLEAHVEKCARCAMLARTTQRTVQALRSIPVSAPPGLALLTQSRVHQRARELRHRQKPAILAWLGLGLSFVWAGLSGLFVWRGLEWVAVKARIPGPVWHTAFGLWWFAPALVVAAILSTRRPGNFAFHEVQGKRIW